METAKELAEWILDIALSEQATLDEGTESEMKIINECRRILMFDMDMIKNIFQDTLIEISLKNNINLLEEYNDMLILLKDNSTLTDKHVVDKKDLPYIVKKIINDKKEKYKS